MKSSSSRTRRRTGAIGLVVATAMLAVGCGSDDSTDGREKPEDSASSVAASTQSEPNSTEPASPPLEGTWQAGPISLKEMEATVRSHGLGQWVKDFRANAPYVGHSVLNLTIENGAWDLYADSGGGKPVPIDYDAEYEIDGDTVVFEHSDGANTHRWSIDGGTLTFEFVATTLPGYRGIPNEVYQRALYMTETFTRQG